MDFDFGLYMPPFTPRQARDMKDICSSTYANTPLKQLKYHSEKEWNKVAHLILTLHLGRTWTCKDLFQDMDLL